MTNPVSSLPSAQLPNTNTTLIDLTSGIATPLFHRFLTGLFLRTGGASGTSSADVEAVAKAALTTATDAQQQAAIATSTAQAADATAALANSTANNAATTAGAAIGLAQSVQSSSLQRSSNLSDLTSPTAARANLGVSVLGANFQIDTLSANLTRFFPLVVACTLPANFAGTQAVAAVLPTASTPLTISKWHAGVTTAIGTVTMAPGSGFTLSIQPAVQFAAGDALVVKCPSVPDATCAQLGLTLSLTLV